MAIDFEATVEEAVFHSPLADFERETIEVEYRRDPLTGEQTRIVANWFPDPDPDAEPNLDAIAGDPADCFFCPDNVEAATPTYPDFVGVDRGSVGEATSFPNLFPYGEHSNVVVLTESHVCSIADITADLLADGLACALEYVHNVAEHDGAPFASINMNFLPSSGSSVVHPHLQTIVDDHGTNEQRRVAAAERNYHEEHGQRYWADLLSEERNGPRYVGTTGEVEWIAPFAPAHQWHVAGVTDVTDVPDPAAPVVADLADGIAAVLAFYADSGLDAYNFAIRYADGDASPVVVDVVARPPLREHYVNDGFYLQTLHDERVVDIAPETYADEVAAFF